jgi:transcriptional regulator with XRE-family HTH domain
MATDKMNLYRTFREQIVALRKKKGWLQEDLAIKMSVVTSRITHILSSEASINIEMIERFAAVFDVDPWSFDLYVVRKASGIVQNSPVLLEIIRNLGQAESPQQYHRIIKRITL